jgi:hypothetical protein
MSRPRALLCAKDWLASLPRIVSWEFLQLRTNYRFSPGAHSAAPSLRYAVDYQAKRNDFSSFPLTFDPWMNLNKFDQILIIVLERCMCGTFPSSHHDTWWRDYVWRSGSGSSNDTKKRMQVQNLNGPLRPQRNQNVDPLGSWLRDCQEPTTFDFVLVCLEHVAMR